MDTKNIITDAIKNIVGDVEFGVEIPQYKDQGEYSTNVAMQLFSDKQGETLLQGFSFKSPRDMAEELVQKLSSDKSLSEMVEKIEIAGPGFINFFLKDAYLIKELQTVLEKGNEYGKSNSGKGKTVVIDYSSPNIAKRFSIGHLRSTIIGQALYNIYKSLGWTVIGDNHLGDWGTQFGVLIYMVEKESLDSTKLSVADWEKLYVDFHKELESDSELKDKSRDAFKRLEEGDLGARQIWQSAMDTSMKEYQKIYDRLDVKIDYAYGESFYSDKMQAAIDKAVKKGIAQKSDSALAVEFDAYNLPSNLLVKSNGTTTYMARDLALMFFRKDTWNPDLQIFEVGADQNLYFRQVFALAEMMGLFTLDQLVHIGHGMIRLKEGTMSTRKGKTIKLEDVLDQAVERARTLGSESDELSDSVGIGAIKWNDLKREPKTEITFDWDEILSMQGNSGPYIQYTVARANSVLHKALNSKSEILNKFKAQTSNDKKLFENLKLGIGDYLEISNLNLEFNSEELELLRSYPNYSDVVANAAKSYSPNLLCNYLYDLAQKYNSYYNAHKIVGGENEQLGLALSAATAIILKNGLTLLGIKSPEKM